MRLCKQQSHIVCSWGAIRKSMSPITHFLFSWDIASSSIQFDRRARIAITLAGIVPDIDGFGIVIDAITSQTSHPTSLFSTYHHILCHNLGFALLVTVIAFFLTGRRWLVAALVWVSFHFHLLCDLAGSRSPDGYQWAIPYFLPFSDSLQLVWTGQWELNAWQNFVLTGIALSIAFALTIKRGISPLEVFSTKADRILVQTLRRLFQKDA